MQKKSTRISGGFFKQIKNQTKASDFFVLQVMQELLGLC